MRPVHFWSAAVLAAATISIAGPAGASDVTDVARQVNLPAPVVESVLTNVDLFFASAEAPANRMTSGLFKELALKAVKSRMGALEDSAPGKNSEAALDKDHGTYKVSIRTTRHESSENAECVDNTATLSSSEALPAIKDGAFTFDAAHPQIVTHSWKMTFCRTPLSGSGGDFSDWQLK